MRKLINRMLSILGYAIVKVDTLKKLDNVLNKDTNNFNNVSEENNRVRQDIAIERYLAEPYASKLPDPIFPFEEALLLAQREIAKALTLSVTYINMSDVKGDIAEFGTMSGFSASVIANAMMYDLQRQPSYPFRKLHMLDSFEGLPEITSAVDKTAPHVISGAWSKGGCRVLSAADLEKRITKIIPKERIRIYEGWFSDTVQNLPDDTRLAMIHFDGDLYQSMMDALVPCFERSFVSRGMMLVLDDWNCNQANPSYGERKAWAELVDKFEIVASHCGDYAEAGTRFIIHNYRGMK